MGLDILFEIETMSFPLRNGETALVENHGLNSKNQLVLPSILKDCIFLPISPKCSTCLASKY